MDKYWRQKEKERIRNKDLEKQSDKGHGLHWQHKHFKPRDIFGYNEKEIKEVKKPELKIKQNRLFRLHYEVKSSAKNIRQNNNPLTFASCLLMIILQLIPSKRRR